MIYLSFISFYLIQFTYSMGLTVFVSSLLNKKNGKKIGLLLVFNALIALYCFTMLNETFPIKASLSYLTLSMTVVIINIVEYIIRIIVSIKNYNY